MDDVRSRSLFRRHLRITEQKVIIKSTLKFILYIFDPRALSAARRPRRSARSSRAAADSPITLACRRSGATGRRACAAGRGARARTRTAVVRPQGATAPACRCHSMHHMVILARPHDRTTDPGQVYAPTQSDPSPNNSACLPPTLPVAPLLRPVWKECPDATTQDAVCMPVVQAPPCRRARCAGLCPHLPARRRRAALLPHLEMMAKWR